MPLPVIAAAIARGAAAVGRVAASAGQAVARGAAAVARNAGAVAKKAGAAVQSGTRSAGQAFQSFRGRVRKPGKIRRFKTSKPKVAKRRRVFSYGAPRGTGAAHQGAFGSGQGKTFSSVTGQQFVSQNSFAQRVIQNIIGGGSSGGGGGINKRASGGGGNQGGGGGGNGNRGLQFAIDPIQAAKDVAKAFVEVGKSIAFFPAKMRDYGAALTDAHRHLSEMNAAYSIATAQLDIRRFQRNVRFSNATSGSFTAMTRAQNRLEDKLLPFAIMGTNLLFKVVTLLETAAETGMEVSEGIGRGLAGMGATGATLTAIKNWLMGHDAVPQNQPLADLGVALGRGNFQQRIRPPMPPLNNAPPMQGAIRRN